jgi:nitrogen fixation/metabolism regulation signal transduction histidine kinase
MKSFSVNIVIRVLLLLLTLTGLAYIFGRMAFLFNHILLLFLLILQVYELIRYVQRTNRELAKLLLAIKNKDFTVSFGSLKQDRHFRELQDAFRQIMDTYQDAKIEKEAQYEYLRLIVRHIRAGIISIRGTDEISLMNQSALDILHTDKYHYWHNLKNSHPQFVAQVEEMQDHESRLIDVTIKGEVRRLSVHLSPAVLLGQAYRIITFQDIASELSREETAAWHKLIRILTHEIMNSVTPVSSLSETMLMMLHTTDDQLKKANEIDDGLIQDLAYSLSTIQKRSEGLLNFVNDYRKLSRLPQPQPEEIPMREMLEEMGELMRIELQKQAVRLSVCVEPAELCLWADRSLLEQVLINLLTNSLQALRHTDEPEIRLLAGMEQEKLVVQVMDNGPGIPADKLDQVFVPFFSTKEAGSGIGLNLSRNIINLHGGSIRLSSPPGGPTVFSLYFPRQLAGGSMVSY